MNARELLERIEDGGFDGALLRLYPNCGTAAQRRRIGGMLRAFALRFGELRETRVFSAPGRIEIAGNHTDHQRGRVLTAAIDLDALCAASANADGIIRVQSEGYPAIELDTADLTPRNSETGTSAALIRGIAARFRERGYAVGGFDAYIVSDVLKGSGLASSAAFEVAIGTVMNRLRNGGGVPPEELAAMGQYAENRYFGKPSGMMDQMASAMGGCTAIDFIDPERPAVERAGFEVLREHFSVCVTDTGGNHADLTDEYAAIPAEMLEVARYCGKEYLREVDSGVFYRKLPELRENCGDRAVLRAIHFFDENRRAASAFDALRHSDIPSFLAFVNESGRSSVQNLQNVCTHNTPREQGIPLALALSGQILAGRGAYRVHGGGFAGTILAFVPADLAESYIACMEGCFGQGACRPLSVRDAGGIEIAVKSE